MNRLPGIISAVESVGSLALVDVEVGATRLAAMWVGVSDEFAQWAPGVSVTLLFKETEVALGKNLSGLLSLRNRMACTVMDLEYGQLLARVGLRFGEHTLSAVITRRSALHLDLKVGDTVEALVKANEMTIATEGIQ